MSREKVKIKYDKGGDFMYVQIGDTKYYPGDGVVADKPTVDVYLKEEIVLKEGSTCVWRNGRLYGRC